MKKISISISALALVLLPAVSLASTDGLGDLSKTFNNIIAFVNDTLIPLVFAIALLVFLYGIFKYFILGGGDETKRSEGRQLMLYSIGGFVLMISIFGIVNLVSGGLGLKSQDAQLDIPNVLKRDAPSTPTAPAP